MKRPLILVLFFLIGISSEVRAQTTNQDFILMIDASFAMGREKAGLMDDLRDLIQRGFDGRIQTGDTFKVWTFNQKIYTNRFSPMIWNQGQGQNEAAAEAVRLYLEHVNFVRFARMDLALSALLYEIRAVTNAHAFLVTDGSERLAGTPFDRPINKLLSEHSRPAKKERRPLVVGFLIRNGQFVSWKFHRGPPPVPAPDFPVPNPVISERYFTNIIVAEKPKPAITAAVKATNPPPAVSTTTPLAASNTTAVVKPLVVAPPPAPAPKPAPRVAPEAVAPAKASPPPEVVEQPKQASPQPAVAKPESPKPAQRENRETAASALPAHEQKKSTPPAADQSRETPKAEVIAAAAPADQKQSLAWAALGGGLAVLAAGLFLWARTRGNRRPQPSLISKSMNQRPPS